MRLALEVDGHGVGVERGAVVEQDPSRSHEGELGEVVVGGERLEEVRVGLAVGAEDVSGSKTVRPTVEWQAAAQSIAAAAKGLAVSASTA